MEITTTMVRFRFLKEAMKKRTDKAQLFLLADNQKVWVPLNKCEIKEDEEDSNYNVVTMPKWLYLKGDLPYFTDPVEFVVTSEITEEQLRNNSSYL